MRTGSVRFRLAVLVGILIVGVSAAVLALTYALMDRGLHSAVLSDVQQEMDAVIRSYDADGDVALSVEVRSRGELASGSTSVYLLLAPHGKKLGGNLESWPPDLEEATGPISFTIGAPSGDETPARRVQAVARAFPGGHRLIIGRDVSAHDDLRERMELAGGSALLLAIALAAIASIVVSHGLLGRVERMNSTVLRILAGQGRERVSVGEEGDEFDELALHFNTLLDRNDRLLAQIRGVTDDIAHDLRTPLARLRVHVEAALSAPGERKDVRQVLEQVLAETDGILATFNALLRIGQIESGALRAGMTEVDLSAIATDVAELHAPSVEEAAMELVTEIPTTVRVTGDPQLLAQAISNLIDNAVKYGSGRVELCVVHDGPGCSLSVADHGPGVPADQRARVIQRFVRLDSSRSRPGTGLGLAFVVAVAELHGAELLLSDNAPGLRVTLRFRDAPLLPSADGTTTD